MAVANSFHSSLDLGICKNHRCNKKFKGVMGGQKIHLVNASLPSHASRQDYWRIRLSDHIYRPLCSTPYRCHKFKCHSFLVPGEAFKSSSIKPSMMALTRSYNALQGSPFIVKLVPAVGIVIFALWGLEPLLRQGRYFFLHKSDSNWRKSGTHYVMVSYLQPLLLWAGAILFCRAFDSIVPPSEAEKIVKQRLLNFVKSLSTVLSLAYCLSSVIQQAQKFFMETSDVNDTRKMGFQFAGKAVYSAVWVAALSLFMELLGFSTQKWLTAGGLGTVLLTLAGREIFTNFLSSAMIHATRPFVVNEWIQTKIEGYEVSGTVEHVGWWSPTIIRGEDREAVHIPNHKFTMNVVRNLTQKTHWRIKTHLAISHLDVSKINYIVADMRKVLAKNPQVEQQRLHRRVFLENVNSENQALLILISCFVKTSHFEEYLCVKEAILLDLLRVISHHRARLATPIRTVQKIYDDFNLDNVPFADTIFTHGSAATAASSRPLLLIEPSYKINGDDKAKTRPLRMNGEHDTKSTARSTSGPKTDANETSPSNKVDAKAEVKPTSSKDPKAVVASPTSDTKVGEKAKASSKPISSTDAKEAEIGNSNSKTANNPSSIPARNIADNKHPKKPPSGNSNRNVKTDSPISISETGGEKPGSSPNAAPQPKQESEKSLPRPALEENMVLGVALDGSKRTLPIEEAVDPAGEEEEGISGPAERQSGGLIS